jgi:hypothetical protein
MIGFWKRGGVSHTFGADARGSHVTSEDARRQAADQRDAAARAAARRAQCLERAQSPEDVEQCGTTG